MTRIEEEEFMNKLPPTSPLEWNSSIYQLIFEFEEFPQDVQNKLSKLKKNDEKKFFLRKRRWKKL